MFQEMLQVGSGGSGGGGGGGDITTEVQLTFEDGIIITPKIAERFDVEVGDILTIESSDKEKFRIRVGGIIENYVSNYIYMTRDKYLEIFGEDVSYNVVASKNVASSDEIARKLLNTGKVVSVSFSKDMLKSANEMVEGLDEVVVVLVIISCMLAITVLYNLTSINISERTREIATLKVLGFYDKEVYDYVTRETIILTIILYEKGVKKLNVNGG